MTDENTPDRFEDRLLSQLQQVAAETPEPPVVSTRARPHLRSRLALSGAGLAGAAALAFVVASGSGGATETAFAVEPQSDGRVTVAIRDLRDSAELERRLRDAGIDAEVDYREPEACKPGADAPPGAEFGETGVAAAAAGGADGPRLVRRGQDLGEPPAGDVLRRTKPGPGGPGAGFGIAAKTRADGSATFVLDPKALGQDAQVRITASSGELSSLAIAIAPEGGEAPPLPCLPPLPPRAEAP